MHFRKRSCDEGLQSYGCFLGSSAAKTEKNRKLKDFHFSSVCEEGESSCTLR